MVRTRGAGAFSSEGIRGSSSSSRSSQNEDQPLILEHRHIIPGRSVIMNDTFEDKIIKWLRVVGWFNIGVGLNNFFFPSLVEEFYRNLEHSDRYDVNNVKEPVIQSKVLGKIIVLQTFDFERIFQVPNNGKRIFLIKSKRKLNDAIAPLSSKEYYSSFLKIDEPGGQILTNMLQDDLSCIHLWLIANIVPKLGHTNEVSTLEGYILHCMKTATRLNLPFIVLNYMGDAAKNSLKGRPYGGYLTTIFKEYGISFEGIPYEKIEGPINSRTLSLQESHPTQMSQTRRRRSRHTPAQPDQDDWPSWQPQSWQPQPWVNEDAYHPVMNEPDEDYTATQDLNRDDEQIDPFDAFNNMHNFFP